MENREESASCIERWLSSVIQSSFFVLAFKLSTFDFVKNIVKSPSIADANATMTSIRHGVLFGVVFEVGLKELNSWIDFWHFHYE